MTITILLDKNKTDESYYEQGALIWMMHDMMLTKPVQTTDIVKAMSCILFL